MASLPASCVTVIYGLANLLVRGETRLTGLVDWDSRHEDGTPETDLLNVVAVETEVAKRRELGEIWLERPWRCPMFAEMMTGDWGAFSVRPTPEVLDAVGLAWRAARMPAILSRSPKILDVEGWAQRNTECVVSTALT